MAESWNKREREKKKQQARKDREEKKRDRKENARDGNNLGEMMAYLDEDGNLTTTPPDPSRKKEIKAEDIQVGVPKLEDRDPSELFHEGVVTFFNEEKGFGFIREKNSKQSIFVHVNQLSEPVGLNDKVQFLIGKGQKGPEALEVKRIK